MYRYINFLIFSGYFVLFSSCSDPGRYYGVTLGKLNDLEGSISNFLANSDSKVIAEVQAMSEMPTTAERFCATYRVPLDNFDRKALKDGARKDIMIKRVGSTLVLWSVGLNGVDDNVSGDDLIRIIDLTAKGAVQANRH